MPLVSGTTAAGFNIVRPLGSGESIELYLASHPRLPRQQLLYLISAEVSADLDYRIRFNEESDLAAGLSHPNIVSLTDRGEFEDQLWVSTDYVEGDDAARLLADSYPDGMPPKLVIEIVSAIAEALDYAHDEGVPHRYVNPSNIFVGNSPSGRRRIALGGFGVARRLGETNTLTRAGMFIGTASYTAPEQLIDEAVDGRADQYALAASAFHLLTGSPPFAHFNPAVVINKHLNDEPPRPSDVRSDLTDFDAIFGRALAKDPVDRFRRSREFAKALEATGGTRSHFLGASAFLEASNHEASNHKEVEAPAFLATRTNDAAPPTQPAAPVTPDVVPPPTAPAPTPPAPPATVRNKHEAPSLNHLADRDVDDVVGFVEPADDDDAREAKRRRMLHAAALGGVILVVVVAWFAGVRALRSASESHDTPTSVDNTTTEPAIPLAPPPSAIAPPPPVVTPPPAPVAPPPVQTTPPPVVTPPPAPVATTPSTTKPSPPPTTTAPANSPTSPPTTNARSTPPTSPTLDTRPAIGMPCSPAQAGSSTVSNSGGPVSCVDTPGGSAWEPPGG